MTVLTPKGRADYAFSRRPGLHLGSIAGLNTPVALDMLEDDRQAQRRGEMADLASLYAVKGARPGENAQPAPGVKGQ